MLKFKLAKPMLVALAACAASVAVQGVVFADDGQTQALKDQMRIMQQQMQDLQKKIDALSRKQEEGPPAGAAPYVGKAPKEAPAETKFDKFVKGFYGALDVSIDATSKGMNGMVAYPYNFGPGGGPPYTIGGPAKAGPYGNVGWMPMMSSNGSNVGYRGSHRIPNTDVDFIYQVSTSIDMAAAPGLNDTWTKSSNPVVGAVGLGDTFVGFQGKSWGKVRMGEMYMPYKTSTDRLNPFAGGLGNYSVIMGNSGGDNRVEFGTRADDVISYASPVFGGFSFEAAHSFGQQVDPNSDLPPLGSPDCAGANNPGSGNLFLNCDDGGFNGAWSGDLKFEMGGLYLVAAYEVHDRVNRSSDGIGANNPYYDYIEGQGPTGPNAAMLDWADYEAYAAEYPTAAVAGTPAYSTAYDVANEWAMKFGGQYSFEFGLTISALWEGLHREVPAVMEFQNERQRNGDWLAIQQALNGGADVVAIGWAHATATVGDPGGQHNYNPNGIGDNQANMYTAQWWHKFDKQLTWYIDAAETINDGNAHYDIGAGGHGIKTDCHDATHYQFVDYSSAVPTTWGCCHPVGVSTGINYKF
ncbi:MAG: porin [Steroidobacteraceae bacterium]